MMVDLDTSSFFISWIKFSFLQLYPQFPSPLPFSLVPLPPPSSSLPSTIISWFYTLTNLLIIFWIAMRCRVSHNLMNKNSRHVPGMADQWDCMSITLTGTLPTHVLKIKDCVQQWWNCPLTDYHPPPVDQLTNCLHVHKMADGNLEFLHVA